MPLPKYIIKNNLRNFISQNSVFPLTPVEQKKAILRGNQLINLFYEIRKDGFITDIEYSEYQKEFAKFSQVQMAVGILHNHFINVVQPNGSVYLVGAPNIRRFQITGDQIAMVLFWSYSATGELILRLLKKVIDFYEIDRSIYPKNSVPKTPDKLTLRKAINTLEKRYKTNAFIDLDIDLRNILSHYNFNFFNYQNSAGIEFQYYDNHGAIRKKRYSLQKIMLVAKKNNILLTALSLTITPSFF
jgi:hypothetical protein